MNSQFKVLKVYFKFVVLLLHCLLSEVFYTYRMDGLTHSISLFMKGIVKSQRYLIRSRDKRIPGLNCQ